MLKINESIIHEIEFNQEQLDSFSRITGDYNPIHTGEYFAEHPEIGGVVVQGMLAASKFGMVFGTEFPGPGTINVERSFQFLRPVFTGRKYLMVIKLTSVDTDNHTATLALLIKDERDICIKGQTIVLNDRIITIDNYPHNDRRVKPHFIAEINLPKPEDRDGMSLETALRNRRSSRYYKYDSLTLQQLSNILWAACGVSFSKDVDGTVKYLFTNPTASNHQEVKLYVFNEEGAYLYEPVSNTLCQVCVGDYRKELSKMPIVRKSSVTLCIVSDIDKMVHHTDSFRRQLYSSMDCGYVSENIYLHCAANGLATCACGLIERERISEILSLGNSKVMLLHPIGIKNNKEI